MSKQVEFFFDFGSPASYLAWTRLPALAATTGAQILWRPMLLGGVFKATGNSSPASVRAKGAYMRQDLQRYAHRHGVPLVFNPYFPVNTLALMRGATAYLDTDDFQRYVKAIFEGLWVKQLNLGDAAVVAETLAEAGLDPSDFQNGISDPQVKTALIEMTESAVARGVFGAPTFFVNDEMFFGQDRLDWVAQALAD